MSIEIGATATAERVVGADDLATVLVQRAGDGFPPVFATARMVGLMELAASRVLHPLLAAGELSVGVTVEVSHGTATPIGEPVVAEARFTGMEGRLYTFEVSARDGAGEIGRGRHKRAIVSTQRLLEGAARRRSGA